MYGKYTQVNPKQKKAGVALKTSDKMAFKSRKKINRRKFMN